MNNVSYNFFERTITPFNTESLEYLRNSNTLRSNDLNELCTNTLIPIQVE